MEDTNLCEYFRRIDKVETKKPNTLKYEFDKGRFECKIKIEKVDSKFNCYIMKVQTNYGYVLDRQSRLINTKVENPDYIIKKFFVSAILGIS